MTNPAETIRTPQNRIKSWTGTVHFATEKGHIACGPVKTDSSYLAWTVEDVTCGKCIARFGADEVTGQSDPDPVQDPNIARRAAERAARRAARGN